MELSPSNAGGSSIMTKIGRPPGSKNGIRKPKPVDPAELAVTQLQAIISNESLPIESRQKALEACKPAPPPTPQRRGSVDPQSNRFICWCDPFSAEGECAYCIAEAPVVTPVVKLVPQVPQLETDVLDLDALARELA